MVLVALTGFMACGKSFFGRAAAARLGWQFIDLDAEIASRCGGIGSIFARGGEEGFRLAENETLSALLDNPSLMKCSTVLALGGGTLLNAGNVALLRASGARIVWLDTSIDIIWSEIGNSERPLAAGKSKDELEAMLEARRPSYRESSDSVFRIDDFDYNSVAERFSVFLKDMERKRVSVYLGSHTGHDPKFRETACEFGRRLALEGFTVVYGGSNVGCMRALAEGCIEAGGKCIGVFPEGFKGKPEVAATGIDIERHDLSEMHFTPDFAERKKKLAAMGDCCVALPGSWGTLDELFTYCTDTELHFNGGKPIFVLNVNGYFDPLKQMISNMFENGFILEHSTRLITFCDSLDELMTKLKSLSKFTI